MPRYLIKRDTWISHAGRLAREGETVDITWPEGAEPKKLGDNMELAEKAKKGAKPEEQQGGDQPLA